MCDLGCHIFVWPDRTAIVDPADYPMIPKSGWQLKVGRGGEYACRRERIKGKLRYIYMHRLIMFFPKGLEVHHINGYGLDNRRKNLQILSRSEHQQLQRMERIAKKRI